MTWVDYVDDVESAIREQIKVGYTTMAVTGTDGHMGAPVERRHIEAPKEIHLRVWHNEDTQWFPIYSEKDCNGCTVWRADLQTEPKMRHAPGLGEYWELTYEITEG